MDRLAEFYKDKRVLITGHTGFKGSWLSIWLQEMGAKVIGVALDPTGEKDNYVLSGIGKVIEEDIRCDIRQASEVEKIFAKTQPEIVFHLAAQPLVRLSYDIPAATFDTNVMGTIHVMEAIRKTESVRVGVMITTDKCYENKEQLEGYKETDPLGGYDPYSASKGAAEIAISSWRRSYFNPSQWNSHKKSIASTRAGNVIGGGDWAKDRIIPDCIRALEEDKDIQIRSPHAVRPWQHVLEPLGGYLLLAMLMWKNPGQFCEAWNFGPQKESIADVWTMASILTEKYGKGTLVDCSDPNALHEAKLLSLNIEKAQNGLQWRPRLSLEEALEYTVYWYKHYRKVNVYELCAQQIKQYMNKQ